MPYAPKWGQQERERDISYEIPHYIIFPILTLISICYVQTFPSILYSQNPRISLFLSGVRNRNDNEHVNVELSVTGLDLVFPASRERDTHANYGPASLV
jgi:hypothetical protein